MAALASWIWAGNGANLQSPALPDAGRDEAMAGQQRVQPGVHRRIALSLSPASAVEEYDSGCRVPGRRVGDQ